ncbi:MAG: lipopolysaccharide biosynthesis protein [Alphaproteobacteria bacterium]
MTGDAERDRLLAVNDDAATLKRQSGRGAAYTILAQGTNIVIHFGWTIIMARLLTPADFGIVAMAAPILAFAGLVASMGLGQAIMQRQHLTHAELSNLYWASLSIYCAVGLIIIAASPAIADFYNAPEVAAVVMTYGGLTIMNGLGAVHGSTLLRQLKFGWTAGIRLSARIVGVGVGLFVAWKWQTYWALVALPIASSFCGLILTWSVSGWRPSWYRRNVPIGSLLGFGSNVATARIMNFFAENTDTVMIGRLWGDVALGFYSRAFKLMVTPTTLTTKPLAPVALTILSRLAPTPQRYRRSYLSLHRLVLLGLAPIILALVTLADIAVPLLLGPGWEEVVPIFQALGILAIMRTILVVLNWLFLAEGRAREFRQWGLIRAGVITVTVVIAAPFGPLAIALAFAGMMTFILTPIHIYRATKGSTVRLGDILTTLAIFVPAAIAACTTLIVMNRHLELPGPLILGAGVLVAYAIVLGFFVATTAGRQALQQGAELAKAAATSKTDPNKSSEEA